MKRVFHFTLAWVVAVLLVGSVIRAGTEDKKPVNFRLEDQSSQFQSFEFPRDRGTVIVACDKDSAKQITGWIAALKEACGEKVDLFGVADVRGVPEMVRPMIRASFKKKYAYRVLLDWQGEFLDSIGFKKGTVNVMVMDGKGKVVWRTTGEMSEETKKGAMESVAVVAGGK